MEAGQTCLTNSMLIWAGASSPNSSTDPGHHLEREREREREKEKDTDTYTQIHSGHTEQTISMS